MKVRNVIYVILMGLMLMLCSCHSQKKVVRGSDGKVINDGKPTKVDRPSLKGTADNKHTKALIDEAYTWLGTPYLYGGNTREGIDCSGFVLQVYLNALDIKLPRVSREQGEYCKKIKMEDLFPGDLVFFITGNGSKVNHVGMYIGDGKMIHASSSKGVMISDLSQKYWADHYHHSGYVEIYRKKVK